MKQFKSSDIRNFAIYKAMNNNKIENGLFLEFGVWKGGSINLFAKQLSKNGNTIYGFDSFEGLKEELSQIAIDHYGQEVMPENQPFSDSSNADNSFAASPEPSSDNQDSKTPTFTDDDIPF